LCSASRSKAGQLARENRPRITVTKTRIWAQIPIRVFACLLSGVCARHTPRQLAAQAGTSAGQAGEHHSWTASHPLPPSPVPPTNPYTPSPPPPTSTPISTPTPLPGTIVLPVDTFGRTLPWLPVDNNVRPGVNLVAFNIDIPPFDNARVRQAFAHAIDRQVIAEMAQTYKLM